MAFQLAQMQRFTSRLMHNWGATIALYTGSLAAIGLYMTDWKVVNSKIPFYGSKFDEEEIN